jgi:hypothetical protein
MLSDFLIMHGHVAGVGLQECTEGRTADDHHLERLISAAILPWESTYPPSTLANTTMMPIILAIGRKHLLSGSGHIRSFKTSSTYRQNCARL